LSEERGLLVDDDFLLEPAELPGLVDEAELEPLGLLLLLPLAELPGLVDEAELEPLAELLVVPPDLDAELE
jgi:hypothetical protein